MHRLTGECFVHVSFSSPEFTFPRKRQCHRVLEYLCIIDHTRRQSGTRSVQFPHAKWCITGATLTHLARVGQSSVQLLRSVGMVISGLLGLLGIGRRVFVNLDSSLVDRSTLFLIIVDFYCTPDN